MTNPARASEKIIITGIPREEVEAALGFIGSSGYQIEVVSSEEETPVSLGSATIEEFRAFAYANNSVNSVRPDIVATRLFYELCRQDIRISDMMGLDIKEASKEGHSTLFKINLDTLAALIDSRLIGHIPNLGKKTIGLAEAFVDERKARLNPLEAQI